MTRIAFVGLGTMGLPMARHLVAAGHDVIACDLEPARAAALGTSVAASPAETAAAADAVLTSLPSPAAVAEVMLGASGVAAGARPGTLVIDLSTGPPELARRLAAELSAHDVLDAPVSGGPHGAAEASLTVMVGGTREAYERALPLLGSLGRMVVHVGPHGAGQTAKLCNNLVAGATMVAVAEACAVAEREGIDPAVLYEIMRASTGDSRVLRTRFPLGGVDDAHPSSHGFEPLFTLDLVAKDLQLALELAEADGVPAPVAAAALARYRDGQRGGSGHLDYSAVIDAVRAAPREE